MAFNKVIAVKRTFENYVKLCNEYSEKYSKTEVENILNNYNQKKEILGIYNNESLDIYNNRIRGETLYVDTPYYIVPEWIFSVSKIQIDSSIDECTIEFTRPVVSISELSGYNTTLSEEFNHIQQVSIISSTIRKIILKNWDCSFCNLKSMFRNTPTVQEIVLENFDTSEVTTVHGMFNNMVLEKISFGDKFDTRNVFDFDEMFYQCRKIEKIELPKEFDMSNAKSAWSMFSECQSLRELNTEKINISSECFALDNMFQGCQRLTKINLSNCNTSEVTNMEGLFDGCNFVEEIDLGKNFNTHKVKSMGRMFLGCKRLKNINLGDKFDTSEVNDMYKMFSDCGFESLDLGKHFRTDKVMDMTEMFSNCRKLKMLKLGKRFNIYGNTKIHRIFRDSENIVYISNKSKGRDYLKAELCRTKEEYLKYIT